MPKLIGKPEYEGSEYTETYQYHDEKPTDRTEDNEAQSTNKDVDTLVQNKIISKHLMFLYFQN